MQMQQVGGASIIKFRSGANDGELYFAGGVTAINKMKIATNGDIIMYKDDGSTAGMTFDASAGALGIGTTVPASLLEVKASSLNRANGISVVGSGANDILYIYPSADNVATIEHLINGSTSTGGVLAINPQGGNVGIGTSDPGTKLSVVSGTNAGISVNDGTVSTILYNTSSANGSVGTTTNHPMAFYANNAEHMRIDTNGNVGIGTTSPSTYADGFAPVLVVENGNNSATIQGRTDGPAGEANGVSYGASYSTNPINYAKIRYAAQGSSGQMGLLAFHTKLLEDNTSQPLERMRIDASGKVGIGTTITANAKLTIDQGTSTHTVDLVGQDSSDVVTIRFINNAYSAVRAQLTAIAAGGLITSVNNTEAMRIDASGNVGIGTSTILAAGGADSTISQLSALRYPQYISEATLGAVDSKVWRTIARNGTTYEIQALNDAGNAETNAIVITRSGMTISGMSLAGNVTMPGQPAASASYSGADITATALIPLNGGAIARGGITISGNRFTVPVAGTYFVGYHHLATATAQITMWKNGGAIGSGALTQAHPTSAHDNFSSQNLVALSASDYIEFNVNLGTIHGNASYNRMYIYLLG
jgi:hypothetical protein